MSSFQNSFTYKMLSYNVPYLSSSQIKFFVIIYTDSNITESQNFHMLFS
jgi:hypothetical protein